MALLQVQMSKILPFLLIPALLCGCVPMRTTEYYSVVGSKAPETSSQPVSVVQRVRVAIVIRQLLVNLASSEPFALSDFPPAGASEAGKGEKRLREATLTPEKIPSKGVLYVVPIDGKGGIKVNGRNYRGTLEIVKDLGETMTVINDVPLEDYVMGVLAGEIPPKWPLEALKAQAIAARTFAVFKQREARKKGSLYDLENTAFFQIYQGTSLVNEGIQKAVLQTQGEILTYGSYPIMAFFHSNCGGRTSRAREVWGQDQPYLKSVPCDFGNNGAHFRWRTQVPIADLVRQLRKSGLELGDVVQLKALDHDESGRMTKVGIMDADGRIKTMKGNAFRMAVGPDIIRSTRFTADVVGDKVVFNGKGWGHGVGLCQEGAFGMAAKGYNAFEILRYYYSGIMIEKLKEKY